MPETQMEAVLSPTVVSQNRPFRHNTHDKAVIVHDCSEDRVDCIVRNLSGNGVKLKRVNTDFVPDHFKLIIPGEQIIVDCQVRWRTTQEIGAEFVDQACAAPL